MFISRISDFMVKMYFSIIDIFRCNEQNFDTATSWKVDKCNFLPTQLLTTMDGRECIGNTFSDTFYDRIFKCRMSKIFAKKKNPFVINHVDQ